MIRMAHDHRLSEAANRAVRSALIAPCRPHLPLSHVEFAERYIRIPTGEYKGQQWRAARLPWARVLFEQLDNDHWLQVVTTGPTQSGKTQQCLTIPTLRRVCEFPSHNIVLGFPDGDMVDKKFRTDFLPIIQSSPGLRHLMPAGGVGSKGGKVKDTITFGNGVVAALMTRGSSDEGKAGFSAPYAAITEAGGFSEAQDTSVETDPFRQIRGRLLAYQRRNRRMMIEGTVKVEDMLPWSMRGEDDGPIISSQSILASPCPHCGIFICPEREHFLGWEDAETEDQAANQSSFFCPACGEQLTEEDRKESNRDLRIVHRGQSIGSDGEVTGDLPPTSTLWFRYSQWHNLLSSYADLATAEWEAAQRAEGTVERDLLDRAVHQQTWCIPFQSKLAERDPLKPDVIRKRTDVWQKNILPDDTEKLTIGVDLGDWTGWWVAIAWRACGRLHIPAYGAFDVKREKNDDLELRLLHALRDFRETVGDVGFVKESGGAVAPDAVWVDIGYVPDYVATFLRECGGMLTSHYKGVRGRGKSTTFGSYEHPKKISRARIRIGTQWFLEINHKRRIAEVTFNADHWKLYAQDRLRGKAGTHGACTLYAPTMKNEHAKFSQHACSEQLVKEWDAKKGLVEIWKKTGQNHWLDCLAMACAAGDFAGYRLLDSGSRAEPLEADAEQTVDEEVSRTSWSQLRSRIGVSDQG